MTTVPAIPGVYFDENKNLLRINGEPVEFNISTDGYCRFAVKKKKYRLHRALALAFIPNPLNLPQVNHKDGNKLNNSLDNLEWCSAQGNIQHAYDKGLMKGNWKGKKSALSPHRKKVDQLTLDGDFIKTWECARDASRAIKGRDQTEIINVCRGKRPYTLGYKWRYHEQQTA